jgi:excisionase family DNA binding protein
MTTRLMDASQLARQLGMSRRWVYAQVEKNDLPAYRIGRALAFDIKAVEAWLAQRRIGTWESCDECIDHA